MQIEDRRPSSNQQTRINRNESLSIERQILLRSYSTMWDVDMHSTVISRTQARAEFWQRIAVQTPDGHDVVGTFKLPAGLKNGKKIRISKARLGERLAGHAWPDDGVTIRIRMPDWRLRNGLAALFVLVGILAGAWRYAALLVAIWGIVALGARYNRQHAVDRFDSTVPRRFWSLFAGNLASTAMLYFMPIAAVIAFYLSAAAVLRFVADAVTVQQLVFAQRILSAASDFFGTWIELKEWPMFLVLTGVWLLTCLLLAWRGQRSVPPGSVAGRVRRVRYGLAVALNRIVAVYGRYSGPVVATLATMASFTFLTNIPGGLGTRLQAVPNTDDYVYAAQQVEAELAAQVVSQLYMQIQNEMPPDYPQSVVTPFSAQVARTREQAERVKGFLNESDPDVERLLTAEEDRIRRAQELPGGRAVDGPRGADRIGPPDDLTVRQAAAAREWARTNPPDNRVKIVSESGKEVFVQLEKVWSEGGWDRVKDLIKSRFPLAAPMVDALADACDTQLQQLLRERVPAIVRKIMDKAHDVKASIAAAATSIAATKDIAKLVRDQVTAASHLAAERQAALVDLRNAERQLTRRADQGRRDLLQRLVNSDSDQGFVRNQSHVLGLDYTLQVEIVDGLRHMMQVSGSESDEQAHIKGKSAIVIQQLYTVMPMIITGADLHAAEVNFKAANSICRCWR